MNQFNNKKYEPMSPMFLHSETKKIDAISTEEF